jgi:hypothetical protein
VQQHIIEEQQAMAVENNQGSDNKNAAIALVQKNGRLLERLSDALKGNEEVVIAAVKQNGQALEFASDALKKNKTVVLAAVKQHGQALTFGSIEMKHDRIVVLAAVQQDGEALFLASQELKNDKPVVLTAVKQNGLAFYYASTELKGDKEVVLAAAASVRKAYPDDPKKIENILSDSTLSDEDKERVKQEVKKNNPLAAQPPVPSAKLKGHDGMVAKPPERQVK